MKKRRLPILDLPPMRCDKGCGECCGIVPITAREATTIARYVREHGISAMPQGSTCPFYRKGACAIYEVRPRVCRAFGHTWKMECPRGYNENVDDVALRRWLLSDGAPVSTLHELAGLPVPHAAVAVAASQPFAWQRRPL